MANRGLSAEEITAYGSDTVEYYYLIEMQFSTTIYESLAPYSVDAIASDDASHEFLSQGLVTRIPTIKESLEIKPSTISIMMSGASYAIHGLTVSENYKNAEVYIYLYEVSTESTTQIFKGYLDSFKTVDNIEKGESTVTWKVANHWTNWEVSEGRFISDANQQSLFPGDLGLEYASLQAIAGDQIDKFWGIPSGGGIISIAIRILGDLVINNLNLKSSDVPFKAMLPLVYGDSVTEGNRVFWDLSGTNNEVLWEVYTLAEGECESLLNITFDGKDYTSFSGHVTFTFHSGTDTQVADANLIAASTQFNDWTSVHQLKGICYVVMRYVANDDLWGSGLPPTPLFHIEGKRIYDPRDTLTAYSTNNSLILLDYLTSTRYGKSIDIADTDGFIAGANYCEIQKTDHNGGEGGTPIDINLFNFKGVIDTSSDIKDNVEDILFTMRANLPFINGKYALVINRDDDIGDYLINDDNLNGKFEVEDGSIKDLANFVSYDFIDEELAHQEEQVIVESSSYLADDNGRVLKQSYSNKYETNRYRAENRAATLLKESREQIVVKCSLGNFDAIQLECGVIVNVTRSILGWTLKPFRVEEVTIQDDGVIKLKLREYNSVVYDWEVLPESGITVNTDLGSQFDVSPPTNLVLTSGTSELLSQEDGTIISRIKATWIRALGYDIVKYNIYIKPSNGSEIFYNSVDGAGETEVYINSVQDGLSYDVTIFAINSIGVSSIALTDSIIVLGKSEAPTAPTALLVGSVELNIVNLSWTGISDLDFSHYVVLASGLNDSAGAIEVGATVGTTFNHATVGPLYYWIIAVDTTGNISATHPSPTNGVLGTPDGLTSSTEWADITNKPLDSAIYNAISFRNGFETEDFGEWIEKTGSTIVSDADSFSGLAAGLFSSTNATADSTGNTSEVNVVIPEIIALSFARKRVRINLFAKLPVANPSTTFSVAYSTADNGNSGWNQITPTTSWDSYSFVYDVPQAIGGGTDIIGIWGDDTGGGGTVLIDNLTIEVIADWNELGDTDTTKPEDNATVGAEWGLNITNEPTSLLDLSSYDGALLSDLTINGVPSNMNVGGFGDVFFQKNTAAGGSFNDGEIRVLGSTYYHPDGTTRILTVGDSDIYSVYEGVGQSVESIYIVWTDTPPLTRFGGGTWGSCVDFFLAIYDRENSQWNARDNTSLGIFPFAPVDTDAIAARIWKDLADSGITGLVSFLGTNTELPADNATVGADWDTDVANIPEEYIYNSDDSSVLGMNPTFGNWVGTNPPGWTGWWEVAIKETVLTRVGGAAVRFNTDGVGESGLQSIIVEFGSDLPFGSFCIGAVSYYLPRYVSGSPAIMVRLYWGAGDTDYNDTKILLDTTTDVWLTKNFKAQLTDASLDLGRQIQRIKVYLFASWDGGLGGGDSDLDIIFDSLRWSMITADWRDISFSEGAPADNADVTDDNLAGTGVNIAPYEYTWFEVNDVLPDIYSSGTATISLSNTNTNRSPQSLVVLATGLDAYVFLSTSATNYNIQVEGGKVYIFSVELKLNSANSPKTTNNATLFARTDDSTHFPLGGGEVLSIPIDGAFHKFQAIIDLTSYPDVKALALRIDNDSFNSAGDTTMYIDSVMFEERRGTLDIASPFVKPYETTVASLERSIVIGGGGIELDSGGSIKTVGFTGEYVDVNPGIWLGWNESSSKYTFGVGDGNEQYIKFDGDDLLIGRDVEIPGVDAFNNSSFYYSTTFDGNVGHYENFGDPDNFEIALGICQIGATSTSGISSFKYAHKRMRHNGVNPLTFYNRRRFKCSVQLAYNSTTTEDFYFSVGGSLGFANYGGFGFRLVNGALYGWVGNSTSGKVETVLIASYTNLFPILEARWIPHVGPGYSTGGSVEFYVDGVKTGSTLTPPGILDYYEYSGNEQMVYFMGGTATTVSPWQFYIYDWRMLQEN